MSRISSKNFITIQGWMLTELGLSGAELIIYAVIWGFTQDGVNWFSGSAGYLAEWAGVERRQVMNILPRLVQKGLLVKRTENQNNQKVVFYMAKYNQKQLQGVLSADKSKDNKTPTFEQKNDYSASEPSMSAKYNDLQAPKKQDNTKKTVNDVLDAVKSEKMKTVLREWVKHKKELGQKMSVNGLIGAINQLKELADNDTDRAFIVRQAIIGGFGSFKKFDKKDLPSSGAGGFDGVIKVPTVTEKMREYAVPKNSIYTGKLKEERMALLRARATNQITSEEFYRREQILNSKALGKE